MPSYHSGSSESVTLKIRSTNYEYSVSKKQVGKDFLVAVGCKAGEKGTSSAADFNARNLSRFLKEGRLERELLAY